MVPDIQLISDAKSGDNNAFKEIVRRYEPAVASTVIGMLGNTQEAEDVGQDTFIRFYKKLDSFRGESSLKTYLTRIAINLSLNELKKRKRIWRIFSPISEKETETLGKEDSSFEQKERKEIVRKAIRKLPEDFRAVIVLRLLSGMTPEETASILEIPVGTVFSRLSRAQDKLKTILSPTKGEII